MFFKAFFTYLVIGALWVNVSAIPIIIPSSHDLLPIDEKIPNHPPPAYTPERLPAYTPPNAGPSNQGSGWKPGSKSLGELPQSFSALSDRDLTFVSSVAVGVGGAIGGYAISKVNLTRFKPENWNHLSSPLKREPEPAPPSL